MRNRKEALALLWAWQSLPPGPQAWLVGEARALAQTQPQWLRCPALRPQRPHLELGDRVLVFPTLGGYPVRQFGTVVYIHPHRRYYTVELDRGCRQSFLWGAAE